MVEKARGFFGSGAKGRIGMDEIPSLARRDFEPVLPVDDRCGDFARRMGGVGLHALGRQVPAGHALEDLAALVVVAHGANHQRIGAKPSQMPRDVEGRAA